MASSFPASVAYNHDSSTVEHYAPSTDAIIVGSLVLFNTSSQAVDLCGADPTNIAGIAEGGKNTVASASGLTNLTPAAKMPVRVLTSETVVALSSPTTLSEANVGVSYGLVNTGGVWQIDTAETGTVSVVVRRVDVGTNTAFVNFLAAVLQFDAIAS